MKFFLLGIVFGFVIRNMGIRFEQAAQLQKRKPRRHGSDEVKPDELTDEQVRETLRQAEWRAMNKGVLSISDENDARLRIRYWLPLVRSGHVTYEDVGLFITHHRSRVYDAERELSETHRDLVH
jgi:hypothetical protein